MRRGTRYAAVLATLAALAVLAVVALVLSSDHDRPSHAPETSAARDEAGRRRRRHAARDGTPEPVPAQTAEQPPRDRAAPPALPGEGRPDDGPGPGRRRIQAPSRPAPEPVAPAQERPRPPPPLVPVVQEPAEPRGPAWLLGRLRFLGPEAWDIGYVFALPTPTGELPRDPAALKTGRRTIARPKDFRYVLDALEPGVYAVGVGLVSGDVVAERTLYVRAGANELDFDVPALDAHRYVIVRVQDRYGKDLDDVDISAGYRGAGGARQTSASWVREADGSYRVANLDSGGDVTATGVLTITSLSHWTKTVEYQPGVDLQLVVRFDRPATLEVTLEGYRDPRDERWLGVALLPAESTSPWRRSLDLEWFEEKSPRKRWRNIEPGSHEIVLATSRTTPVARIPVLLAPGENAITVEAPVLHSLVVARPARSGCDAALLRLARVPLTHDATERMPFDGNGLATFENLAPGRYVVALDEDRVDRDEMLVDVPSWGARRFVPVRLDAIEVTVDDPRGVMAASGLRTGDRIVGIGDSGFRGAGELEELLRAALLRKRLTVAVLRGDDELRLEIDSGNLANPEVVGGRLAIGPR